MTIAKALKHKNRVAARMAHVSSDIQAYSSFVGKEPEINVKDYLLVRNSLKDHLIALKTKISTATEPIRHLIFEMGELKAEISFYRSISTIHGTVSSYSSSEPEVYTAQIRKEEINEILFSIEARIDEIQDELDKFNVNTTIETEIPDGFLAKKS